MLSRNFFCKRQLLVLLERYYNIIAQYRGNYFIR